MNEINFEIKDVEKIDLSMDVGVKEIFPPIENLEVTPTKEQQVFNHNNSYGYDEVIVNPIPDEYIIPDGTLEVTENGDIDVTTFKIARVGVYTPPNLQDKSITITENGTQNITFDEGYDGLNNVEVKTEIGKYAPRYISFYGYTGTELDQELANLDFSNMTSTSKMFYQCKKLYSKGLIWKNVSMPKVTTMSKMFYQCSKMTSADLSNWNLPELTSISELFSNCTVLKSVNLSGWYTPKLVNMEMAFYGSTITSIDLSSLDMTNITNFENVFGSCQQLASYKFPENFTADKVTSLMQTFYYNAMTTMDLSKWNPINVTDMTNIFGYCTKLESVNLSSWTPLKLTNVRYMFNNCYLLKHVDVRGFDFTITTRFDNAFTNVPTDCEIIVADDTQKEWFATNWSTLTNVKTVAEL